MDRQQLPPEGLFLKLWLDSNTKTEALRFDTQIDDDAVCPE